MVLKISFRVNKKKEAIKLILNPVEILTDLKIDFANDGVEKSNKEFEMISTVYHRNKRLYDRISNEHDDVQIFNIGGVDPTTNIGGVGHFICVHYKALEKIVYIYVPLRLLCRLYPEIEKCVFSEPKTLQRDFSSCGVFAIAYATTIILGEYPTKYIRSNGTTKIQHCH